MLWVFLVLAALDGVLCFSFNSKIQISLLKGFVTILILFKFPNLVKITHVNVMFKLLLWFPSFFMRRANENS